MGRPSTDLLSGSSPVWEAGLWDGGGSLESGSSVHGGFRVYGLGV